MQNAPVTARLNISTGHETMSDKKSNYVQRKLFHNGHSCRVSNQFVFISYSICFYKKHSVSIGFTRSGVSFYEHFNRQFTYAVSFIFKTVRYVSVKRFFTNSLIVVYAAWDSLSSKNILYFIT